MIYLFFGENTYACEQELTRVLAGRESERVDGETLELRDLPELLTGRTLFADTRQIVIRGLAGNVAVWNELEKYIEKVPSETTVILIDAKPDKRTKTYKLLLKFGTIQEFMLPKNPRDAEQLAVEQAKRLDMKFDAKLARLVVERVGLGPWNIVHALEKLAVLDTIDKDVIERTIDASPSEQVFGLFEASLRGDSARVHRMCEKLSLSEDAYRVMGLLSTQVVQLAALTVEDGDGSVAKDLGLKSDYGLKKLRPFANTISRKHLRDVVGALADADVQMKSTGEDPWALIEQALQKIAALK